MIVGKVIGSMYSTINHKVYDKRRMLVVRKMIPKGGYIIAFDAVDSGVGDTVLIVDEGNSARQVIKDSTAPVRSVIVGIVDEIQK